MVVSCFVVLGIKLWSSGRAAAQILILWCLHFLLINELVELAQIHSFEKRHG